jgi:hypothetical protein
MKKIFFILSLICIQHIAAQNIMDFDLKNVELQGMKPVKINQEMKNAGITQVPFMTENPAVISKIVSEKIAPKVKKLYAYVFSDPKDNLNDGGVYIYQFNAKKDLEGYIAENFEQSNYRVLVKDLFYIRIWSDYGYNIKGKENSEDHLNKLEKYYIKLGAKRIQLKPDESIIESAAN